MNDFKSKLWPLIKNQESFADMESTGRSSATNYQGHKLKTQGRQTAQFELTSIYEQKQSEKTQRPFIKKGNQLAFNTAKQKQVQIPAQKRVIYKNINYEVLNLTWTLYNINPPRKWFGMVFALSLIARLYITIYLLFILYFTISGSIPTKWMWIIVIFATRVCFGILILKVSLFYSDGPLETTLKSCWNKRQIAVNEVFQVLTFKIVKKALVKAITPPELAFTYLAQSDFKRKFLMYSIINYIFLSIETTIFYPFMILYCYFSIQKIRLSQINIVLYTNITLATAFAWIFIFLVYSIYLLINGIKIKYQKMVF